MLGIVTINGVVGAAYTPPLSATSNSQVKLVEGGLNTCMTAVLQVALPKDILGLADHVPLNTHQKTLVLQLDWFTCVVTFHVWPPVADMSRVPEVALDLPEKITRSPTCIPAGGVTIVGLVIFVPLSAGVLALL